MTNFFKKLSTSCLGTVLGIIAFFAFIFILLALSSGASKESLSKNNLLYLNFQDFVPERTGNTDASFQEVLTENSADKAAGLTDIIYAIRNAKTDDKISGIYLEPNVAGNGMATLDALRTALLDFKDSGKFIYSYAPAYSQGSYYMASIADSIFIHPLGGVDFHGFSVLSPFFKDVQDRLGIKREVFYVGKFKGATEPFRRNNFSEENRLQTRVYLESLFSNFSNDIGTARNISDENMRSIADNLSVSTPQTAIDNKFIDKIAYRDEVITSLKTKLNLEAKTKINLISPTKYLNTFDIDLGTSKDKIAVLYAEGELVDYSDQYGVISSNRYVKAIKKITDNEKIKALVLRVNSRGGSVFCGEEIWHQLDLFKKTGRPIVVSMGDYAASGGYYISTLADTIYAEPNTLTGSIGVFGVITSYNKFINDKLHIHMDTIKTTQESDAFYWQYDLNEKKSAMIQTQVEHIYDIFLDKVSKGRNMTTEEVHEIAQGRVWTGETALKIGLVDKLGGLAEAIETAKNLAGLDSYKRVEYPKFKTKQEKILEMVSKSGEEGDKIELIKEQIESLHPAFKNLITTKEGSEIKMECLLNIEI